MRPRERRPTATRPSTIPVAAKGKADFAVQESVMKAWRSFDRFQRGSGFDLMRFN